MKDAPTRQNSKRIFVFRAAGSHAMHDRTAGPPRRRAPAEREESMVTTIVSHSSSAQRDLKNQLIELANAQFVSPEYQRLVKARFTSAGAKAYWAQHAHFNLHRRDV